MPRYVASRTLAQADWNNTTVLSEDVAGRGTELKREDGGDILVYGSAGLVRSLLPQALVDRIHLLIYPTVLGRGTRLFPADYAARFDLEDLRQLGSGIVHAVHSRADVK